MWFANNSETQIAQWDSDTALGITGVEFRYWIYVGGVRHFLQVDLTTFAPTDYSFVGVQSGLEWSHTLTIPTSALDYNLTWEATPNLAGEQFQISETHFVAENTTGGFNFDGFVFNGITG